MKSLNLVLFLIVGISFKGLAQAPANDECNNAIAFNTVPYGTVCSNSVSVSTAGATQSTINPSCTGTENNDDVWYRFTAQSESVIIRFSNVINNATSGQAVAGYALYMASCPASAVTMFCSNLGSAGAGYRIHDGLEPGTEYYVRFWSTLTGTNTIRFDFCVQDVPAPPPNDECTAAISVATNPVGTTCNTPTSVNSTGSTQSSFSPTCASTFTNDDVWYSFTANSNAVQLGISDAVLTTVSNTRANVGFALYETACPNSAESFQCDNNIGSEGTVLIGGLTAGTIYYLRFYSFDLNNYMSFNFCLTDVILAENDECIDAIELSVTDGFCLNPTPGDLTYATSSPGFSAPDCAGLSTSEDVWFSAIVPATGQIVIQTYPDNSRISNLVMEVYGGQCNSLTLIACDNGGNNDPGEAAFHSRIVLSGRTPGEQLLIRVLGLGTINWGKFNICAYTEESSISISEGGDCISSLPVRIDSASHNLYRWVPIFDASQHIIAEIFSNGTELGETTVSVFKNTGGSIRRVGSTPYLDRNISVSAEGVGLFYLRFYITDSELQILKSNDGSILSASDLAVSRTAVGCTDTFGGTPTIINLDSSAEYSNGHFIEFRSSASGSFFAHSNATALPLKFLHIDIARSGSEYLLNWKVVKDANLKQFRLQQSMDGIRFIEMEIIEASNGIQGAHGELQYRIRRPITFAGTAYLRLIMQGFDGEEAISKIVSVSAGRDGKINVYPNPFNTIINIDAPGIGAMKLQLFDMTGRMLKEQQFTSGAAIRFVPPSDLNQGVYLLRITDTDGRLLKHKRLLKINSD